MIWFLMAPIVIGILSAILWPNFWRAQKLIHVLMLVAALTMSYASVIIQLITHT
jgi:hypothetical protein